MAMAMHMPRVVKMHVGYLALIALLALLMGVAISPLRWSQGREQRAVPLCPATLAIQPLNQSADLSYLLEPEKLDELGNSPARRVYLEKRYQQAIQHAAATLKAAGGIRAQEPRLGHTWNLVYQNNSEARGIQSYWNYFAPMYTCPSLEHVGNFGDGGKWLCALDTLLGKRPCIVYSFGSNALIFFEADILASTACDVHVFDPTVNPWVMQQMETDMNKPFAKQRIWFHSYGLAVKTSFSPDMACPASPYSEAFGAAWPSLLAAASAGASAPPTTVSCRMLSLSDVYRVLKHEWVDILKMDIEGAEIEVFKALLQHPEELRFTQLSFEAHFNFPRQLAAPATDMLTMLQGLQDNNFHSFFLEVNTWSAPETCVELSYLNIDPATGLVVNSLSRQRAMAKLPPVRGW